MKLFGKTRQLIEEIEFFYDTLSKAALVCKTGIEYFLDREPQRLSDRVQQMNELESHADNLRRSIEHKLYSQMLIPDVRGDVLGLLEASDNVVDWAKKLLTAMDIEQPQIPDALIKSFRELLTASYNAMDEMVKASRSYFHETEMVSDHINKVYFFEHEADKLEDQIKRKAFRGEEFTELSRRVQMRYFAERLANLSDQAEAVANRLAIAAIKRSI
jgi:predicted phosphate transport protein (TIGR00153 family)